MKAAAIPCAIFIEGQLEVKDSHPASRSYSVHETPSGRSDANDRRTGLFLWGAQRHLASPRLPGSPRRVLAADFRAGWSPLAEPFFQLQRFREGDKLVGSLLLLDSCAGAGIGTPEEVTRVTFPWRAADFST